MDSKLFLSTQEYAQLHSISKMQVTRLIKSGKVPALRVGNAWMIYADPKSFNQSNFLKTSTIQSWAKLVQQQLHKTIDVEKSKDRELIYARLHSLDLPHDRYLVFPLGSYPSQSDLKGAISRLGFPYWISAVPDPKYANLDRQAKLHLNDFPSGWEFLSLLQDKDKYKIIISQYPDNAEFKGTALVSKNNLGIAEFATGDRHYLMTRGYLLTDPLLFDKSKIIKYSSTISKNRQDELFHLIRDLHGHFEFQYASHQQEQRFTFFDYTNDSTSTEVDSLWKNLDQYFNQKITRADQQKLHGLPCVPGMATGPCLVTHHEDNISHRNLKKGDILVTDTITPEMTEYLKLVSGIITDLGGVTSHAAIVLRALNIPTIVGAITVTSTLRTGQKVIMDASKGSIDLE